jgi:micrococcal nuclease
MKVCQDSETDNRHCFLLDNLMEYIYKILVTRVVDGDTIDAEVDLGFNLTLNKRIRLHGIDTPETRTTDKEEKIKGLAAKKRLQEIVSEQDNVLFLKSMDQGKFGRCIGVLFAADFDDQSINDLLVQEGHAVVYGE